MFVKGNSYLLQDIYGRVGGLKKGFLPHQDGKIVCGRFRREFQPFAPDIVFIWVGESNEKESKKSNYYWAIQFHEQKHAVPIFMSVNTFLWEYLGDYYVERVTEDPKEIERYRKQTPRENHILTMVLFLKEDRSNS